MSRNVDAPTGVKPSTAWGDLGVTAGLLAAWLIMTRWILPAMGFPSCEDGGCGAPAVEGFHSPASTAGPIVPTAIQEGRQK